VVLALTLRAASAVAEPVDVLERGATGDGRTDDTAAIQTAVDSTKDTGGEVYLPAGTYLVTAPIGLYARSVYRGAGAGATALVTPTSGPGFPVFRVATPRRCAEGNGACDGAIGARRRGAGCVCYDDDDCARGACAGGTVQRRLALRDLEIRLRTSNAVGVDAALIGESTISNVSIVASDGTAGTVGMVFSDGNGKVSGYSDTVTECHVLGLERGVVFLPRANDHRLIANVIERGSVAVVIRPTVNATHIISNLLQSFASRGIEDHGDGTCIIGNRFEARAPHIALEADGSDAQVVANYHGGAGAPIQDAGMKDALVLETTRGAAARGALGNMAFDALSWAPRASAPFACSAARDGSTYFDAGLHRLCLCDGSRATWCPLQVERDALGCGSATACR
jgi:hypothetical protein